MHCVVDCYGLCSTLASVKFVYFLSELTHFLKETFEWSDVGKLFLLNMASDVHKAFPRKRSTTTHPPSPQKYPHEYMYSLHNIFRESSHTLADKRCLGAFRANGYEDPVTLIQYLEEEYGMKLNRSRGQISMQRLQPCVLTSVKANIRYRLLTVAKACN